VGERGERGFEERAGRGRGGGREEGRQRGEGQERGGADEGFSEQVEPRHGATL
jgi:hypothetical protein